MGAQCGLSTGYISLIEKEINPQTGKPMVPSLPVMNKLALGMGLTLDELLSMCDDMDVSLNEKDVVAFSSPPSGPDSHDILLNSSMDRRQEGAPVLSTGAQRVAMAYDELSQWGQKQVRTVVDNELERMSDGLRSLQDLDPPPGKVIYVFLDPAWVINEDDDESVVDAYTLKENDPPQAEYGMMPAMYSMGSDFPVQNVVFVNHEPMADGDIGVFYYENETVIRQWHEDKYGIYLLTLDRKCADKDIVIPRNKRDQSEIHAHYVWGKHLVWLGRVITRKRYEVPPHQLISDDENRPGKEPER